MHSTDFTNVRCTWLRMFATTETSMAGNRALYDRAMEQSREAARQKNWTEALKQAGRALQEFPSDADARSSAAVALFNTGRFADALRVFEELRGNDTTNPFFLEYIARINEQMGNQSAAVGAYRQLAELQQSRRLVPRAIDALREVLRLQPDADDLRAQMAQLMVEAGGTRDAAQEYLDLARRAQAQNQLDKANTFAEQALRLDAGNRDAKELIATLHAAMSDAAQTAVSSGEYQAPAAGGMTSSLRSQQFAVDNIIKLAQQHQEAGDADGAIEQYERAITLGTRRSDVFYSLGLLYQERGNQRKAADALQHATGDAEYALSAHYALGTAYQELGELPKAAQEFEHTIRLVDLQSIGKAESDDLIQMYESAAGIYVQLNDIARAGSLYSGLADFLHGKRWGREQADAFRRKAKELADRNMFAKLRTLGTGALTVPEPSTPAPAPVTEQMPETWGKIRPITDFLRPERIGESSSVDFFATMVAPKSAPAPTPVAEALAVLTALPSSVQPSDVPVTALEVSGLDDPVVRLIQASETYMKQALYLAALDACMEVIRLAPEYLLIHLRMGEIYEREGRPEEALTKYQLLIDTLMVRNEPRRAIGVYYKLIDLSPDTINARLKLSELLKNDDRAADAAEQLVIVAGSYFRMGQTNKALEEYRRGLQWAPNNPKLHAQYGQALLKLERYEAALGEFRKALELHPQELAGIARINIVLALMSDQPQSIWQSLATLLERLKAEPQYVDSVQGEYRTALLVADVSLLHYILGVILQRTGQHNSALLELEQAAALLASDEDPLLSPVLVYQAMADSYMQLGQPNEVLQYLDQAQELASQTPTAVDPAMRYPFSTPLSRGELVRRMAEAFSETNDLEGAERALQEAKQHIPYDRAVYTKLADVYFRQGKLNEALAQLDELATHYESRQDLDKAIETLEYGQRLAPSNIANSRRLAQLCIRRGYLDKGLDGLNRVAELQRKAGQIKDAVTSLQQVADVHWTLGQHDQARSVYDRIVKVAPNDVEARQWLSFMYTLGGRTADAVNEKKQIVRIFLQQRDYEGAIAELHQIIGLNQNDVEAYFQLGDVLMRREEYDQAVRIYSRLANMPNIERTRVEALQTAAKRMLAQQMRVQG